MHSNFYTNVKVLRDHFKVEVITDEMILTASDCDFHEVNDNYTPHSRAVVQHYLREGKYNRFRIRLHQNTPISKYAYLIKCLTKSYKMPSTSLTLTDRAPIPTLSERGGI